MWHSYCNTQYFEIRTLLSISMVHIISMHIFWEIPSFRKRKFKIRKKRIICWKIQYLKFVSCVTIWRQAKMKYSEWQIFKHIIAIGWLTTKHLMETGNSCCECGECTPPSATTTTTENNTKYSSLLFSFHNPSNILFPIKCTLTLSKFMASSRNELH